MMIQLTLLYFYFKSLTVFVICKGYILYTVGYSHSLLFIMKTNRRCWKCSYNGGASFLEHTFIGLFDAYDVNEPGRLDPLIT